MADELKYVETEEEMQYFLETGNIVGIRTDLEREKTKAAMDSEHITTTPVIDSDGQTKATLYLMAYNSTAPTGGSRTGVAISHVTREGDQYKFTPTWGVLGIDRESRKYIESLAGSVLDGFGIDINYNNPNWLQFCDDFAHGAFGGIGTLNGRAMPAFYKLYGNGLKYYLGLNDYKIFGEWFRAQGILPYMIDSTDDDIYINNLLKVKAGSISTGTMINRVVSNWVANTDLGNFRAIPPVQNIYNAFNNMVSTMKSRFKSITGFDKEPNVFRLEISGSERLARVDMTVIGYYIKNFEVIKSNPLVTLSEISANGGCGTALLSDYRFGYPFDWNEGGADRVCEPVGNVGLYPVPHSQTYTSGCAGFNVFVPKEQYVYCNVNSSEHPSDIDLRYRDLFSTRKDFSYPQAGQDIVDYLKHNNPDYVEEPTIDPYTGDETTYPIAQLNTSPVPPGTYPTPTERVVNITRTINPTPTPPPPEPSSKDEGDTDPPPSIISGASNDLFTVYNPTDAEIKAFGSWLWSEDMIEILKTIFQNPLDGVLSLQLLYATPETGESKTIKCGYLEATGVTSAVVTNQFIEIDCGGINLFEHYGDARDYSPYTDISLYLPFIGFVDLDVYEVMGGVIRVKYNIDVLTGSCLAFIISTRDGSEKTLYTFNGNCSVQLPLTSADKSQIITGAISGAISGGKTGSAVGALAGGAGAGIGAAAGAVLGGAWGGFTGGVSIHRSGEMGANVGALGIKKPYLIVKRYVAFSASGYGGLLGYADNYRCRVGDVSGYSVFSNPVVNVNATASELDEIMNYLTTGIIV